PDIFVVNDTTDNLLYINQSTPGKLSLKEVGLNAGVARDDRGVPNCSNGVDVADYDNCGRPSLWGPTHENERPALSHNHGAGIFCCRTDAAGIAAIGQQYVGFGTAFLDIDNDGWLDLIIVTGHVERHPTGAPVKQKPVLLRNLGNGRFTDITKEGGIYFRN